MDGEMVATTKPLKEMAAAEIRAQVNLIQEIMKSVMKDGEHYGKIPGCKKKSLWKPGAEKLMVSFRIAPTEPKVEDLSTTDLVRYRVTRGAQSIITGKFLGSAIGECSSDEEKYRWRKPICDEEFNETPEDRRREVWKKYDGKAYKAKQVRMSPADVANTILKMADKRAMVALALTTTAASDIFTQDIEDLSPEVAEAVGEGSEKATKIDPPKPKAESSSAAKPAGDKISEAQRKRFFAIWKGAGKVEAEVKAYLLEHFGSEHSADITRAGYEAACSWAEAKAERPAA